MPTQSAQFDLTTAFLDQPKFLGYGLVRGAGNKAFQHELADKTRICFYLLAEGPWDSLMRLWLNRKEITLPNTAVAHFHPGLDGEIGFGMGGSSTGGDQHVDSFWASVPGTLSVVTFGRYAYLAVKVPPDPGAPSADLEVLADYQALKCRVFDASGNQTAFQWTQNPAWWICDFMIRKFILREAKINQPLVSAELARFDWQSFSDTAAYNDANIGGGIKRFSDGGLVFLEDGLTADRALEQMLLLCRCYILERNGKISLYPDKARASVFTFTSDNIEPRSFLARRSNLRSGKNQIKASWREVSRASGSTDDATRFAIAANTFSHRAHQRAIGTRGPGLSAMHVVQPMSFDYGNNTAERVARLAQFQLNRFNGDDSDPNLAYKAPFEADWIAYEDSAKVECGDVVTIAASISEEYGGALVEVLEIEERPDGSRALSGLEYQPNAFPDSAPTQQGAEAPAPGSGLMPVSGGGNFSYALLSNPLHGTDAGTSATIPIDNFTMRVEGVGDLAIPGGDITGLFYETAYFVYYDDLGNPPTGETKVFLTSGSRADALNGAGRFFCGSIVTPRQGAGDTIGFNDGGAGAQYTRTFPLVPSSYTAAGWSNPERGIDDDSNSFADASTTSGELVYEIFGFQSITRWMSQLILKVLHQFTLIASGASGRLDYSIDDGASWINERVVNAADSGPVETPIVLSLSQRTDKVRARMRVAGGSGSPSAYCGTAVDASGVGTLTWSNPTNAQGAPDGNGAGLGASSSVTSHWLKQTNFQFSLPSGAVPTGIEVTYRRKANQFLGPGAYFCADSSVKLVKGGTISGNSKSHGVWAPDWETVTLGSPTDLWGLTLIDTDIETSTFGFAISAAITSAGTAVGAYFDSGMITVYYSLGSGSGAGRFYAAKQEVTL